MFPFPDSLSGMDDLGDFDDAAAKAMLYPKDEAVEIERAIAEEEMQLRVEARKMKKLKQEMHLVDSGERALSSRVHRVLGPKLELAHLRFEKNENVFKHEERKAAAWKKRAAQLKREARHEIQARDASRQAMLEARAVVARAEAREHAAEKVYVSKSQAARREAHNFKQVDSRYKAEASHAESAREGAQAAKHSAQKLSSALAKEERKIDDYMSVAQPMIQGKMHKLKSAEKRAMYQLDRLEDEYSDAHESQVEKAKHTEKMHEVAVAEVKVRDEARAQQQAAEVRAQLDKEKAEVAQKTQTLDQSIFNNFDGLEQEAEEAVLTSARNTIAKSGEELKKDDWANSEVLTEFLQKSTLH